MINKTITQDLSPDEKDSLSNEVYKKLSNYLFDNVVYINLAYSDLGSGGTTSTTDYGKLSRIIDTAEGRLMAPGKESRFRCQFYVKNIGSADGYILSPAVYDSQLLPSSFTTMSVLRSYFGIKIYSGNIMIVSKEADTDEKITEIDFVPTMYDSTYTDTVSLEIKYNITSTDIYINNTFYGSYSSDIVGSYNDVEVFYPFFSPARSIDGSSVNIVAENLQFIQKK